MTAIAPRLLRWFDTHGRHDLPWQHPRSAYRVWISEAMLQQTQVVTAIPYFQRFVRELPDIATLAAAPLDDVFALWSGLGYYSRARRLHETAGICMREHGGELPQAFDTLLALPGIGRSTAGAIMALAHDQPFPILDGNVRRVLCRHRGVHGWPGKASVQRALWRIAQEALPDSRSADYTQALMDLGAMACTPTAPACGDCPLREDCVALRDDTVAALPERRPPKALPMRDVFALIARDAHGRVLLQRRPAIGVWAGLWSLPEAADIAAAQAWVNRHARADAHESLPTIPHAFSHYRLRIHPLLWREVQARSGVRDNDGVESSSEPPLRWQSPNRLHELGLPAPIRKLLEELS